MINLRCFVLADLHSPDDFVMGPVSSSDFDVVFTLGDIGPDTIDYILSMTKGLPVIGILGNHDPQRVSGIQNIDGRVVEIKGIKVGGFSGAPKYKDAPNHLTDKDMQSKVRKMPKVDIVISHAPPLATSADRQHPHKGYEVFDEYIKQHRPQYWLHGHLHENYERQINGCTVYGVYEKRPLTLNVKV